jgi:hemolysin III
MSHPARRVRRFDSPRGEDRGAPEYAQAQEPAEDRPDLNRPVTVRTQGRFSIARFTGLALLQLGALYLLLSLAFPQMWARQIAAGPLAFVIVFVAGHLFLSVFEWFFHRYVLHLVTARWLGHFAREHRKHHSLTAVRLRSTEDGSHRVILNEYPITQEVQNENAAFPFYAMAAFWAIFALPLLAVQWALPQWPILLGGFAAIAWSMMLYEILHAIEHWPYQWWRTATEHPRFGRFWRLVYGFHLMHHANVGCNESISGFFSLPLSDLAFGTYHQPRELLLEGRKATAEEFTVRPPLRAVRWLDRWARGREARIQRRAG